MTFERFQMVKEMITRCLHDVYQIFSIKITAVNLSKKQALDDDPKPKATN